MRRTKGTAAITYWDCLLTELTGAPFVFVDIGANVSLWDWAIRSDADEQLKEAGIRVRVIVPVTKEQDAVAMGLATIRSAGTAFPDAEFVLVLNEMAGDFEEYEGTKAMAEVAAMKSQGLQIVTMPFCTCERWTTFEDAHVPPIVVAAKSKEELRTEFNLPKSVAARCSHDMGEWIKTLRATWGDLLPA